MAEGPQTAGASDGSDGSGVQLRMATAGDLRELLAVPFSWDGVWPGVIALVAANLVPLAGVLVLGWDLGLVLLLYWAESALILASNLLKLVRLGLGGVAMAAFFSVHAGMFMLVHLIFLVTLFHPFAGRSFSSGLADLGLGLAPLAVSHAVSFAFNHVRRGESHANAGAIMGGFYARIVVMHLTILFGGFAAMALGSPVWALALLILLKTAVDLGAHLDERRRHAAQAAGTGAPAPS